MEFVARAPGSCGELIQGMIDEVNFHVTCPINIYSVARVKLSPALNRVVVSGKREKTIGAVEKLLSFLGMENQGLHIEIESNLPLGKGMASSTADIIASCVAVAEAFGRTISPYDIARISLSVEPTDGLMFPGIVAFDHVRGLMYEPMPGIPELDIFVVDTGGIVDTGEFNSRVNLKLLNKMNEDILKNTLEKLILSMQKNELMKFGECCSTSAFANQKILEKASLAYLYNLCTSFGGVGVNAAHSGTVVGFLFPRNKKVDWDGLSKEVSKLGSRVIMGPVRLIGGGPEVWKKRKGHGEWIPYNTYTEETSVQQPRGLD